MSEQAGGRDELMRLFEEAVSGAELDDLRSLAGRLLGTEKTDSPAPADDQRYPRRGRPVRFALRAELVGSDPVIWRSLEVRSDLTLDRLHHILQAAFDWTDSHLHRFTLGDDTVGEQVAAFLCPYDVEEGDEGIPEEQVRLDEVLALPGDLLHYRYDYGDDWHIVLRLGAVRDQAPGASAAACLDGDRAAPPENCGGRLTGPELAQVLVDPAHFAPSDVNLALQEPFLQVVLAGAHPAVLRLLGRHRDTPTGLDLLERLAAAARTRRGRPPSTEARAAALQPFLWFLDRVGAEGLALTSAGYLRPEDVTATAAVAPRAADWIGKANREANTFPVLEFRESLQQLGLLRKHRGRLVLTRAGAAARGNPDRLWQHLLARLPLGKPRTFEAELGVLVMVEAAVSPDATLTMAPALQVLTEDRWQAGDRPLAPRHLWATAEPLLAVLLNLASPGPAQRQPLGGRDCRLPPAATELALDLVLGPAER